LIITKPSIYLDAATASAVAKAGLKLHRTRPETYLQKRTVRTRLSSQGRNFPVRSLVTGYNLAPVVRSGSRRSQGLVSASAARVGRDEQSARWHVPIDLLLIVWGIVTAALVIVVIYRGTLSLHEDDQLFLGDSEAHLAREQQQLVARLTRLNPVVRLLGIASGFLIVLIATLWIWRGLSAM
jgi:hypothetical protein